MQIFGCVSFHDLQRNEIEFLQEVIASYDVIPT